MSARIAIEGAGFGVLDRDVLDAAVERRARWLIGQRARRGDRVLVRARSDRATIETMLATLRIGAVLVPIAEGATACDVEHVVATTRPRLRFDEHAPLVDPVDAKHVALPSAPSERDAALVIFTSGTTGKPKGAVISHGAIDACNRALADAWSWSAEDVISLSLPLFHVHGLCLGLLGSLARGTRIVIEPRFSVTRLIEQYARDGDRDATEGRARPTMLFSVPTMLYRLVEHMGRHSDDGALLARGRLFVSGSAPLPLRDLHAFRRATGHDVVERYGLTETLMNTANRWSASRGGDGYREGSVGRVLPGVALRLDGDDGREVASGEIGEVTIASPSLFDGYVVGVDDARDGALVCDRGDAMRDGRFATGDVGRVDEDGFLWLLGRKSTDVIKSAGFKVGAAEVEAAFLDHPDVAECAVIGVPDDDLGERIVAAVVLREGLLERIPPPDLDAVIAFANERLAPYKRPAQIGFPAALPRNAMGKIQKKRLIDEHVARSDPRRDRGSR